VALGVFVDPAVVDLPDGHGIQVMQLLSPGASRDAFYDLGDIKLALSQTDAAVNAYQRAAEADKTWGKPVLALGRIAMTKGDLAGASKFFQTVITVDPASPEAAQAKTLLAQITK